MACVLFVYLHGHPEKGVQQRYVISWRLGARVFGARSPLAGMVDTRPRDHGSVWAQMSSLG